MPRIRAGQPKRTLHYNFAVTEIEHNAGMKLANAYHVSVSELLRMLITKEYSNLTNNLIDYSNSLNLKEEEVNNE